MSLVEAAAALDRLLAGQTRDASTSRLWSAGTASVPRWGVNPASASPQSPLPNTRTAFLDHTLSSEGLVPAQSTKVVLHSTPKDDTSRHAPPQLPLLDEAPLFETLRNPPTLTPAPVSTLTSTPARTGQAHYFVHASHAAPPSPSIPVPASLSIPIPTSPSLPVPASLSIPIPTSPSLPASHSLPVSSHSFTTSRPIPISASSSVPASSSSPSSSPIFLSALPNPCPVEGRSAEARGPAGVSELWPEGVRSGRKGGRSLAFLFSRPDPTKFKTELCRSYQVHGFCRYGMRCNYAHGLQQLRGAIHHGKYKTRNCKSYHEKGCCRYGARCSFIHDPEEGVLKCSIANKEVLEALHYCPDSEESFRTAKITWRLVDSSSSPPPELHFITSNTQDTQAAHRDAAALISGTGVEHGPRQLHSKQDVTPLSLPAVRHAPSGVFGQLEGACKHHVLPVSALGTRGNKNVAWKATPLSSRTWRKACSEHDVHHPECRSQGQAAGHLARLQHPAPACRVPPLRRGRGGWYNAEELMDMEVVQSILRKGPRYSATCWSAAEETDATRGARSLPNGYELLDSGFNQIRNVKFKANHVSKRAACRGREHAYLCGPEQEEAWGEECEAPFLCSTLQSDSDSEDANLGASDESSYLSLHARDLASAVQGRPHGLEGWAGRDAEGQVCACTSLPARRHCFDLTKYKTEICRSFQYNSHCCYGDACLYAHGTLDLRSCPRHPMYRTKQCFSFHHRGYCLYGSRCQFMHDLG